MPAKAPLPRRQLGPAQLSTICCALAWFGGCSPEVGFELVFPSEETWAVSSTAQVDVYTVELSDDGTSEADDLCRNLTAGGGAGRANDASTGQIDVCQLDGAEIADVPVGRMVMFARVFGGPNTADLIMSGCRVADVYADTTEPVQIGLTTLPAYPEDVTLSCEPELKCVNDTPCL